MADAHDLPDSEPWFIRQARIGPVALEPRLKPVAPLPDPANDAWALAERHDALPVSTNTVLRRDSGQRMVVWRSAALAALFGGALAGGWALREAFPANGTVSPPARVATAAPPPVVSLPLTSAGAALAVPDDEPLPVEASKPLPLPVVETPPVAVEPKAARTKTNSAKPKREAIARSEEAASKTEETPPRDVRPAPVRSTIEVPPLPMTRGVVTAPRPAIANQSCRSVAAPGAQLVCGSSALSTLDRELARLSASVTATGDAKAIKRLAKANDRFLARRDACTTYRCVADKYDDRLEDLARDEKKLTAKLNGSKITGLPECKGFQIFRPTTPCVPRRQRGN